MRENKRVFGWTTLISYTNHFVEISVCVCVCVCVCGVICGGVTVGWALFYEPWGPRLYFAVGREKVSTVFGGVWKLWVPVRRVGTKSPSSASAWTNSDFSFGPRVHALVYCRIGAQSINQALATCKKNQKIITRAAMMTVWFSSGVLSSVIF